MNVTMMKRGDKAVVTSFHTLPKSYVERLMDVGIYESAHVTLLNILAMGRLFLLEVDDIEICIRKDDAKRIEVNLV